MIKVYYSDQAGAPVLNGLVGSLIAVLDACLIDGYNQVSVTSITRVANIVTVQTTTAHGYAMESSNYWTKPGVGNVATIAGASQTDYNGDWPITVLNSNTFTFDIGVLTPSTPATGTIISKRAAAGFSKPFTDTNRAAYRSNDLTSRRFHLYVNDTADCANSQGARFAWWRGYEKMSSIDTGENLFPLITQSGVQGQYIRKSSALDATSRRWTLISDGKSFFFQTHPDIGGTSTSISTYAVGYWFGDYLPMVPDGYAVLISGDSSGASSYSATTNCGMFMPSGTATPNPGAQAGWDCIARKYTGMPVPVWASGKLGHGLAQNALGLTAYLSYPDNFSNRMYGTQVRLYDAAVMRGTLPIYEGLSGVVHSDREVVTNMVGLEGKNLIYIRGCPGNSSYNGGLYFDVTGNSVGKWS